ncbi:hypothetical protein KCU81_g3073, partial [Aureobasidium melanogenum]|uniref:Uncharacterized protein n=1 Tax=Aureobasidium melanogenum (strain CBS 110374) TaxID=1043003 RepID=A0A074W705_AURM1
MDPPTDPPPPYSFLQVTSRLSTTPDPTSPTPKEPHTELEIGDEALIYEEWEYRAHPWISIWLRRSGTRSPDHVNVSYGINKDTTRPPLHNEPDIFFTCRFQPRRGDAKDKDKIHMYCCIVTGLTVLHREAGGMSCDCNWWTLNDPSHECNVRSWGLSWIKKWWQTIQLWDVIWDHDQLCSCGCFDVAGHSSLNSLHAHISGFEDNRAFLQLSMSLSDTRNFSFILASNHATFSRDLIPQYQPLHTTMPFADFLKPRRSGLLALLRCIDEGDRDELHYISYDIMSDTRNASLPIYDLSCSAAVMGLCHANWLQAEGSRLLTAHACVLQRAAAATLNPNAIDNIDEELRGLLLSRLNAKQVSSAPPTGLLKVAPKAPGAKAPIPGFYSGPIADVSEMRQLYRDLGYAHKIEEFDTYPERVMDHATLRKAWEERARKLGLIGYLLVDMETFSRDFSPYYNVRSEDTVSKVIVAVDPKGISNVVDANIISGSSATTNNQQTTETTASGGQQTQAANDAEAEALERKRAKNRKKNQNRKANKKAQKAEQQEGRAANSNIAGRLAENFTLKSSDTFVNDSGLIEGVNAWTIQSWVRKSDDEKESKQVCCAADLSSEFLNRSIELNMEEKEDLDLDLMIVIIDDLDKTYTEFPELPMAATHSPAPSKGKIARECFEML